MYDSFQVHVDAVDFVWNCSLISSWNVFCDLLQHQVACVQSLNINE